MISAGADCTPDSHPDHPAADRCPRAERRFRKRGAATDRFLKFFFRFINFTLAQQSGGGYNDSCRNPGFYLNGLPLLRNVFFQVLFSVMPDNFLCYFSMYWIILLNNFQFKT
ncbi:MAG: hypothetical protein R2860_11560 [Desulfobacterales bacterium]